MSEASVRLEDTFCTYPDTWGQSVCISSVQEANIIYGHFAGGQLTGLYVTETGFDSDDVTALLFVGAA